MSSALRDSYRLTASLLRRKGISFRPVDHKRLTNNEFVMIKDYLDKMAVRIADELDRKADELENGS